MGSGGPTPSCCLAHQRQRLLPHLRVLEFDNTMRHRLFLDVRTTLGDAAPARCGANHRVGVEAQILRPINSLLVKQPICAWWSKRSSYTD